uniref:Uncharacterized protein n=1 Tax=Romanomermis culicivorax TaxID=13658 RepID=A0A915I1K4_ROMCU
MAGTEIAGAKTTAPKIGAGTCLSLLCMTFTLYGSECCQNLLNLRALQSYGLVQSKEKWVGYSVVRKSLWETELDRMKIHFKKSTCLNMDIFKVTSPRSAIRNVNRSKSFLSFKFSTIYDNEASLLIIRARNKPLAECMANVDQPSANGFKKSIMGIRNFSAKKLELPCVRSRNTIISFH